MIASVEFDQVLTGKVIGEAIEVHRQLGPGAQEPAYEKALSMRLSECGIEHSCQHGMPVCYKGVVLDAGLRLDLLVEGKLLLELKAVERVLPIHEAQLLTYMRLGGFSLGLLLNFEVAVLREGIRRRVLSQSGREGHEGTYRATSFDEVSGEILNAAAEVRREMGRQLLRSVYQTCLAHELRSRALDVEVNASVDLRLDEVPLGYSAPIPLLVDKKTPVFPLSVAEITPRHEAQVLSRLRQTRYPYGLIINFHAHSPAEGIRRITLDKNQS